MKQLSGQTIEFVLTERLEAGGVRLEPGRVCVRAPLSYAAEDVRPEDVAQDGALWIMGPGPRRPFVLFWAFSSSSRTPDVQAHGARGAARRDEWAAWPAWASNGTAQAWATVQAPSAPAAVRVLEVEFGLEVADWAEEGRTVHVMTCEKEGDK